MGKRALSLFWSGMMVFMATSVMAGQMHGFSDLERLGGHLYKDKNLSFNGTQSCQDCHHPAAGFADRENLINPYENVVSVGADGVSTGTRNAPTAAYAGFSPLLEQVNGEWVGGLFWDGRADGSRLGDPLAEQAQGPPLNPVEMAMPSKEAVIAVIASASYASLFYQVFGPNALEDVDLAYDYFARAVAAHERTRKVTRFTSKYDRGRAKFTAAEERGLQLFESNCAACHATLADNGAPAALFTNFGYYNIGVPANPLVPLASPDLGLGPVVGDPAQNGKFKVPTLRNVAVTPPYTHNGYFPTLTQMVSFMNDNSGYPPEYGETITDQVGSLGLASSEIDDIVAFLMTLTDGY